MSSSTKMFTDDVKLIGNVANLAGDSRTDLDILSNWTQACAVTFIESKCFIMNMDASNTFLEVPAIWQKP